MSDKSREVFPYVWPKVTVQPDAADDLRKLAKWCKKHRVRHIINATFISGPDVQVDWDGPDWAELSLEGGPVSQFGEGGRCQSFVLEGVRVTRARGGA